MYPHTHRSLTEMTLWMQTSPAYVSIRQHTSAFVSIRQHSSAYVSIRQHTSAYVSRHVDLPGSVNLTPLPPLVRLQVSLRRDSQCQHTSASVSILQHTRQHTSAYVSIRVSIRQHTSAYVSVRQHTSAYTALCTRLHALLVSLATEPLRCQCFYINVSVREHT